MENSFQVTEDVLASNNMRFVNYLIDLIPQYGIVYGAIYLLFYIAESTSNYALNDFLLELSTLQDYIFTYSIMLGYYFFMEGFTNRTLGKYVTKTLVVTANGNKPTYLDILKRSFCRLIPFDALSFLGAKGKGWHDSLSKTYVVDVNKFEAKRKLQGELNLIGKQ
ncbi:RDD family protein [Flavivirga eckloniae]|uniref:RDD family protein n=1 Tax=Flavivirga eckloniae TaxID=1803846 RepID=A0A2K9PPN6_9FLAO|nr:RDD family protein [Flavivirga eckloniae]AUP79031.1 RDD family protein [Flavivirga eckloniae]